MHDGIYIRINNESEKANKMFDCHSFFFLQFIQLEFT